MALREGCWFDIAKAEHVEAFFANFLRHSKGAFAGQMFTLLPWQRDDLFYPLFGWQRRNEEGDIVRRFVKAYVEIPKKNGKSTIASGVGLYMLAGDGEMGAEVFSAACDRNQANIVHREACNMVEASPELMAALKINKTTWNISYPDTRSFYRALSSTPSTNEGLNAHCILADELHEWRGLAGRALYDALRWAFAARRNPLFFQITTSGEDMISVCREQHDYVQGILAGTNTDTSVFGCIKAAGPKDDPWAEATWIKANPSLGATITLGSFRTDAAEAKKTPIAQSRFKRYRLGIWSTGDSTWLRPEDWEACRRDFGPEHLQGCECYAALDLSRTQDSTSLQLAFPCVDDVVQLLSFFFFPADRAQELSGRVPWDLWAAQGYVQLIPGRVIEFSYIEEAFAELAQQFHILGLLYDPTLATDTTIRMEQATGVPRVPFGQSAKNYAAPTGEFERRVLNQTLEHNGHPVMTWQIGNAVVRVDRAGNKSPKKPQQHDERKIDGVAAGVMALAGTLQPGDGDFRSWYDDEGHEVECG